MAKKLKPMFANDDFDILGFDPGNDKTKMSLIVNPNVDEDMESKHFRDLILQNSVVEISESEWKNQVAYYEGRRPNYGFIGYNDKYYAVGDAAIPYARDFRYRKIKAAKYQRDYIGLLFVSSVMQIYNGNPPEHLHVICGHPPLNRSKKKDIEASLGGVWEFHTVQGKERFRIHTVRSDDEISAAAFNRRYRVDGVKNGHFKQEGLTLGFDLGGATLDVVFIDEAGRPVDGTHDSAEIGVFEVVQHFKELFDEKWGHLFKDNPSGISLDSVYRIFRDRDHILRGGGIPGGQLDCSDLFEKAAYGELNLIFTLADQLAPDYRTRAQSITVFGGAGELFFNELSAGVFDTYADNGYLFLGTNEAGFSILNASRGLAKLGQLLRRGELQMLKKQGT